MNAMRRQVQSFRVQKDLPRRKAVVLKLEVPPLRREPQTRRQPSGRGTDKRHVSIFLVILFFAFLVLAGWSVHPHLVNPGRPVWKNFAINNSLQKEK